MKEELTGKSNWQGEILIVQKGFQMSVPSGTKQKSVKILVNARTPAQARFFSEIQGKNFRVYGSEREFSGRWLIYTNAGEIYLVQKATK